jgi:hypothetical protein
MPREKKKRKEGKEMGNPNEPKVGQQRLGKKEKR